MAAFRTGVRACVPIGGGAVVFLIQQQYFDLPAIPAPAKFKYEPTHLFAAVLL